MVNRNSPSTNPERPALWVGFYSSVLLAVIALITFGFAITAVPVSGANCLEGCFDYPYLDTLSKEFKK